MTNADDLVEIETSDTFTLRNTEARNDIYQNAVEDTTTSQSALGMVSVAINLITLHKQN